MNYLQAFWKTLGISSKNADFTNEDDIHLATLIRTNEIYINALKETQSLLSQVGHNVEISTADIVIWNADRFTENEGEFNNDGSDESDIEQDIEDPKVSYAEAISSTNTLIKWNQGKNNAVEVSELNKMRENLVKNYYMVTKKQTSIGSFFKPVEIN